MYVLYISNIYKTNIIYIYNIYSVPVGGHPLVKSGQLKFYILQKANTPCSVSEPYFYVGCSVSGHVLTPHDL